MITKKQFEMIFEEHQIYHIYNQGNNKQKIFFSRDNYLFFLKKLKIYVLPYADILAWCLMPNHFHLMVYVHTLELAKSESDKRDSLTHSEAISPDFEINENKDSLSKRETIFVSKRDFNQSIGLLMRSYTQAINKKNLNSGSLFRKHCKAECVTKAKGITPSYYNTQYGALMKISDIEKEYPQICFNYIHLNPVVAGLTVNAEEWEFSSCLDYLGNREGKLINKNRANEFGLNIT
jgi:putative transposase